MARKKRVGDRNAAVIRARELRRRMSPPEAYLWQVLRTRPGGFKFRRQHPLDRCTGDFYCAAAKLVVEVDGISHEMGDNAARDLRRDAWLREEGLSIIRFNADDVMKDVESVVTAILLAARR
ncbi:MAG: endonuclease domain-containing protein [Allosphingosinicella sp.]